MISTLPESVEVGGAEYAIRFGYRPILDICTALSDPALNEAERACVALDIFYPGVSDLPPEHYQQAVERCLWFINGGEEQVPQLGPRLVDWEQDFPLIAAPVNRVLGTDIRRQTGPEDGGVHWWTFLSAYQEIGECTFAQVVRIRDRLARGRPLDKQDREWYRRSRHLVDFRRTCTEQEESDYSQWLR